MVGLRRGGVRRELKKRGRGMKDRVDKSMGVVTLQMVQTYLHQGCSSQETTLVRFLR